MGDGGGDALVDGFDQLANEFHLDSQPGEQGFLNTSGRMLISFQSKTSTLTVTTGRFLLLMLRSWSFDLLPGNQLGPFLCRTL